MRQSVFSAAHTEAASCNCMIHMHVMWTPPNNLMALYLSSKSKTSGFSGTTSTSTSVEFSASVVIPTVLMPQYAQVLFIVVNETAQSFVDYLLRRA